MIKYFALLAMIAMELSAVGVATAQSATNPVVSQPQRRVFNPFLRRVNRRLIMSRFGLPRLAPAATIPLNSLSQGGVTTTSRPAAAAPLSVAATSSAVAPQSAALESVPPPQPLALRPPFRPPVRSPYRPPPRPPF
jgi:hypothetical protein